MELPLTFRSYAVRLEEVPIPNGIGYMLMWAGRHDVLFPEIAQRIRENFATVVNSQGWSSAYVEKLINSLHVSLTPHGILVTVPDKIFAVHEKGRRERIPYELLNKTVPIVNGNDIIFRKVTGKSLGEGKWRQPALPGKYLLQGVLSEFLDEINAILISRGEELFRRLVELSERLLKETQAQMTYSLVKLLKQVPQETEN